MSGGRSVNVLQLRPGDDVGIALAALEPGDVIAEFDITLVEPVAQGHKVALRSVPSGDPVRKYGQVIGFATQDIAAGGHVHTHNLEFKDETRHAVPQAPQAPETGWSQATFEGYLRADGRVGTRNYIGVIASVNCSSTISKMIASAVNQSGLLQQYPQVDGVVAIAHDSGCGLPDTGPAIDILRRTLRGYMTHPNFGAILVVGLGCEVNQLSDLLADLPTNDTAVESMSIQDAGGSAAAVNLGVEKVRALVEQARQARRSTQPISRLVLGLKCGGSDGFSGLTANPALGFASDMLVSAGGSSILCETPEIVGAEHLLAGRAASPSVAEDLMGRVQWWREYVVSHGASLDNNPSPGNKAGGISTILEKSLGAVAKSGSSPLNGVIGYAEPISTSGLVFMDSPGYDPVSVTGMVAAGANIVCFTTGRGSVYGCKPVPTLKLATNSDVYRSMAGDMDINCGAVLDEGVTLEEMGRRILELIIDTASGRKTLSEQFGFGDEEFVPWRLGAVM